MQVEIAFDQLLNLVRKLPSGSLKQHKANLAKELKMSMHNPPIPAVEYLSPFVQHISSFLLGTQAHPPPSYNYHGH